MAAKLVKLHTLDNVQIVVEEIMPGEQLLLNNNVVQMINEVSIGHKIAEQFIKQGEKIIKYGVSIGSATADIAVGTHVHLHNMKSDYIPTYTIEDGFKEKNN